MTLCPKLGPMCLKHSLQASQTKGQSQPQTPAGQEEMREERKEEITQLNPKKVFCTHNTQYLQGRHLAGPTKKNTKWTLEETQTWDWGTAEHLGDSWLQTKITQQNETHKMLHPINQAWAPVCSAWKTSGEAPAWMWVFHACCSSNPTRVWLQLCPKQTVFYNWWRWNQNYLG